MRRHEQLCQGILRVPVAEIHIITDQPKNLKRISLHFELCFLLSFFYRHSTFVLPMHGDQVIGDVRHVLAFPRHHVRVFTLGAAVNLTVDYAQLRVIALDVIVHCIDRYTESVLELKY